MTLLAELEQAAKARRERGNCGPYPTGEEYDLAMYSVIVETVEHLEAEGIANRDPDFILSQSDSDHCPVEFVVKVLNDLKEQEQ